MTKILLPGEELAHDLTPNELRAWEDSFNMHRVHVPTFWIVHKRNPWFKVGTRLRRFRDGYEEVALEGSKMVGYVEDERVVNHEDIAPYILAIQKKGVDLGAARQDRQRAMGKVGDN